MLTSGHYLLIWDIHVLSKDNIYTVAHGHEYLYCQYKYTQKYKERGGGDLGPNCLLH